MSSPTRTAQRARARKPGSRANERRPFPLVLVIGVLVAIGALVTFVVAGVGGDSDTTEEYGEVAVTGTELPPLQDSATDPAVGSTIPRLVGADFDGSTVTIEPGGSPKIVMFVAHWCPHCRAEVPVVQDWLDDTGGPGDVELYSVATAIDPSAPNYPTSEWLEREGWTVPVLIDDRDSTAGGAFGVSAYPFFVAVDGDGNVAGRLSGELSVDQLESLVDLARS